MKPFDDIEGARLDVHRLRSMFPDMETSDAELWESMIESETTIPETIARLYNRKEDLIGDAATLDMQIKQRQDRKARLLTSADNIDNIILRLFRESNVRKVELPEVTLSVRAGSKSVDVYEPEALPPDLMRVKPPPPPEPDKAKIAEALKAGKIIPGARLKHGPETLQERKT